MAVSLAQTTEKKKVLILASRPSDFRSTINYLNRREFEVEVSPSLSQAIEAVAAGNCDYLLLSIDFPGSRAEILPQVLEQSFPVVVIVFAEIHDRRTIQRLGSLRARNILFSQPSGPSIIARMKQTWIHEKKENVSIFKGNRAEVEAKVIGGEDRYLSPKEFAAHLLERLRRSNPNSEKQRSTDIMVQDVEDEAPSFLVEAPPVVTHDRKRRPSPLMEYDELGNPIARPTNFETKLHETVWDTADNCLQDVCPTKSRLNYLMGPITEAELMCIDSMNFKGTFVVAYSGDEGSPDGSPLFAAEKKLIEDLKLRGFHIRDQDVTILPMFDFAIPAKLLNSAEVVVTHTCRQFDVSLAFYSSTKLIPMFEPMDDPMLLIDIGQFLPGTKVNVDIFLPMPLNKKYVRYWRRGSVVTEEQLNRVASHGAVQLGVRRDQLDLFSQYCAYQAIHNEVTRNDIKRAAKKKLIA